GVQDSDHHSPSQALSQDTHGDEHEEQTDFEGTSQMGSTPLSTEDIHTILSTPFAPGPGNPLFGCFETMEEDLDIEALPTSIPETSPLRRKAAFWTNFPFANTELLDLLLTEPEPEQGDDQCLNLSNLLNSPLFGSPKQVRGRSEPLEDDEAQRPAKRARAEDTATSPSSNYTDRVHIKSSMGKRTHGAGTRR
ncbi:12926_t:CDS:2, partial [Acaulospora colombiana]